MRRTLSGASLAATGSMLFRSPVKSNPVQYALKGMIRSECPAACARLSRYAASRFCCAPGALVDIALTTKTIYHVFNTVVLVTWLVWRKEAIFEVQSRPLDNDPRYDCHRVR